MAWKYLLPVLVATHGLYLAWSWKHPRLWVPVDAKAIKANGSADTLLSTFHRQRATWRTLGLVLPAFMASLPLGLFTWATLASFLGLVALGGGYWLWWFNPALNLAQKLPYKKQYFVSWNPKGARLDVVVWTWAWLKYRLPFKSWGSLLWPALRPSVRHQRFPTEADPPAWEDLKVMAVASPLYENILDACLLGGIILYVASLAIITWLRW